MQKQHLALTLACLSLLLTSAGLSASEGTPGPKSAVAAPTVDLQLDPHLDHYQPISLNEFAIARLAKGELRTAWILLERAALLAPHDLRIVNNLATLRVYRTGHGQLAPKQDESMARQEEKINPLLAEPAPPARWPAE